MNGHQETSNVKCIRQSSSSGNFRKTLSQKKKKKKRKETSEKEIYGGDPFHNRCMPTPTFLILFL